MKYFSILVFVLSVSACSSGGDGSTQNETIIGTWEFIFPATQCSETYTFSTNNTFALMSLDEILSGTYSFSNDVNASNRQALSFMVTSDNQQTDCEGGMSNNTGDVVNIFAEFITPTQMQWHQVPSGIAGVVTVNKI